MRHTLMALIAAVAVGVGLAGSSPATADTPTATYRYTNTFTGSEPNPCLAGEAVQYAITLTAVGRVTDLPGDDYGASNAMVIVGSGVGTLSGATYRISQSFTSAIAQSSSTEAGRAQLVVRYTSGATGLSFGAVYTFVNVFDRTTTPYTYRAYLERGSLTSYACFR